MPAPNNSAVPGLNVVPLGEMGTFPYSAGSSGAKPPTPPVTITAAPVLSWLTNPEAYEKLVARGVKSPGNIPLQGGVQGWKRTDKWDVKEGKGSAGATETHVGIQPAKGSFTFEIWDEDGIAAWAAFLALFKFDKSKGKGAATDVYHPTLASLQPPVTSVVMTDHTPLVPQQDGRGMVTIELLEYFPTTTTGATTASGSQAKQDPDPTGTQEDPAIKVLQSKVAALAQQAQALP